MKYKEFQKTDTYLNTDVIEFLDENYEELLLDEMPEDNLADFEVLCVNESECAGFIEVILKV